MKLDMLQPQWYVLQTEYGYEQIAENNIKQMVESQKLDDVIFNVVVPKEEKTIDKANGKKKLVLVNKYPNYIYIKMIYSSDTYYLVKHTKGIKDFIKGADSKPIPMQPEDVKQTQLEEIKVEDINIAVNDKVNIISGPFKDWQGDVVEIKGDEQKVRVNLEIFGRITPMDLDLNQVEKI